MASLWMNKSVAQNRVTAHSAEPAQPRPPALSTPQMHKTRTQDSWTPGSAQFLAREQVMAGLHPGLWNKTGGQSSCRRGPHGAWPGCSLWSPPSGSASPSGSCPPGPRLGTAGALGSLALCSFSEDNSQHMKPSCSPQLLGLPGVLRGHTPTSPSSVAPHTPSSF